MRHFHEKKIEAQKAAKASEMHQKRITGFIAKMIKTFWNNVEKASHLFYILLQNYMNYSQVYFLNCVIGVNIHS